MQIGDIVAKLKLDNSEYESSLKDSEKKTGGFMDTVLGIGGGIAKGFALAGTATTLIGGAIGSVAVQNAAQFEKFEATLTVMLGSADKAKARLKELSDFAAKTPFELPDVIELGNQLQAIGRYSKENMTILGDLAAASGKSIDQVTGAFAKLSTGQKGVAVDMFRDLLISTDDWVAATGKGVDKTGSLMATTEEMLAALPKIMNVKGFSGMMETQAQTFEGKMSNLTDSFNTKMRELGEKILPHIKPIIEKVTEFLSNINIDEILEKVRQVLEQLRTVFEPILAPIIQRVTDFFNIIRAVFEIFSSSNDDVDEMSEKLGGLVPDEVIMAIMQVKQGIQDFLVQVQTFIASPPFQEFLRIMREIADNILKNVQNAFNTLGQIWQEKIMPALQKLVEALQPLAEKLFPIIGTVIGVVVAVLGKLWEIISSLLTPVLNILGGVLEFIINLITEIIKWFTNWIKSIEDNFNKAKAQFEQLKAFISAFIDGVKAGFENFRKTIENVWNGIKSSIEGAISSATQFVKDRINDVIRLVNGAIGGINELIKTANSVTGLNIGTIGQIPYLAKGTRNFEGGMAVVGEKGSELVNLPDGSSVTPANRTNQLFNLLDDIGHTLDSVVNGGFMNTLAQGLNPSGGIVLNINMDGAQITDPDFAEDIAVQIGDKIVDKLVKTKRIYGF